MTPEQEQLLLDIQQRLARIEKSDRYIFAKNIQLLDGRTIQVGLSAGTQIATAATQKLSFWGKTPVTQPAAPAATAAAIISALQTIGIFSL